MAPRKRFKEYSKQENLTESSWLSKGFALGQGNRHAGTKTRIDSTVSQIQSACDRGVMVDDLEKKLSALFEAVSKLGICFKLQAELSHSVINVGIASNLLEDDIKAVIRSALKPGR